MQDLDLMLADAYAVGYFEGRTLGFENTQFEDDVSRHYYRLGYDRGVADYCEFDADHA